MFQSSGHNQAQFDSLHNMYFCLFDLILYVQVKTEIDVFCSKT